MAKKELKSEPVGEVVEAAVAIAPVVQEAPLVAVVNPRLNSQIQTYLKTSSDFTMKFVDPNGRNALPIPEIAVAHREGGDLFKLCFYYLPGTAPRGNAKDSINTGLFDNNSFMIQTGVDERSGKPKGKLFKKLTCVGWAYDTHKDGDQKYEKIVCLTEVNSDWDSRPLDPKTMAPKPEGNIRRR